jgi:hypothetical protein
MGRRGAARVAGGDVDDAAAGAQARRGLLDEEERRGRVDLDDAPVGRGVDLAERLVAVDAGVVDERVQVAVPRGGDPVGGRDAVAVERGLDEHGLGAGPFDQRGGVLGGGVLGEADRDGPADPPGQRRSRTCSRRR